MNTENGEMKMGKIFYIIGKSSTGKDTIYKNLLNYYGSNFHTIIPYTTRPIREGETNGIEYFFVDELELQKIQTEGKLIEVRSYNTFHGIWKYFTVNDSQIDLENKDYLIIGTLESFAEVRNFFGSNKVIPILIELDDGIRLQRALDREQAQTQPKYEEMCRRFLADSVDFSSDKVEEAGIIKRFNNEDLEKCLDSIRAYIEQFK